MMCLGSFGYGRHRAMVVSCEHSNERLGFIKVTECL
jgi:hypothetical protein